MILFIRMDDFRMVDLVEKAVQVNITDSGQISEFFQYLQHVISKHLSSN